MVFPTGFFDSLLVSRVCILNLISFDQTKKKTILELICQCQVSHNRRSLFLFTLPFSIPAVTTKNKFIPKIERVDTRRQWEEQNASLKFDMICECCVVGFDMCFFCNSYRMWPIHLELVNIIVQLIFRMQSISTHFFEEHSFNAAAIRNE